MMHKLLGILACYLLLALPRYATAQTTAAADSAATAAAVATATQRYTQAVQTESVLFSGPEYVDYTRLGTLGHQFFLSAEPQAGTVNYRQGYFEDVALRYDLALDRVVLTYPKQLANIVLVPEQLTAFSLGSRHFVRVVSDSATSTLLPTGYYELLQAGPISLLARHTKYGREVMAHQSLQFDYKQVDKLFARSGSRAVEVTRLKDLLALLPAHKADVQRYARQQKLRFSAAKREASATAALRYYYTLPQ